MSHDCDYLKATLQCRECGASVPALVPLDVRDVEIGRTFQVGDALEPELDCLDGVYFVLRLPNNNESLRVVMDFSCVNRHKMPQWAEIVFMNGRIESAESATLDLETLRRAHAISGEIAFLYERRHGIDIRAMSEEDRNRFILEHPLAAVANRS